MSVLPVLSTVWVFARNTFFLVIQEGGVWDPPRETMSQRGEFFFFAVGDNSKTGVKKNPN